ncbi:MAG: uroporphyrinogen-III synthase [Paracoccaceae bacterium]
MARQSRLPAFLLTRPAFQGDRFAAALRNRFGDDIQIVESPLLAPRFLISEIPQMRIRALVFTSETGVQAFARISAESGIKTIFTAWCVGDRTAQAARSLGLNAISSGGDATDLATAIIASGQAGPVLHLRGQDARGNLSETLTSAGIETHSLVCYAQDAQPFSSAACMLLGAKSPVVLPLFSPRTAGLFVEQAATTAVNAPIWVAAMSPSVAEVADRLHPKQLVIATRPDADAMIEAVKDLIAAGE